MLNVLNDNSNRAFYLDVIMFVLMEVIEYLIKFLTKKDSKLYIGAIYH